MSFLKVMQITYDQKGTIEYTPNLIDIDHIFRFAFLTSRGTAEVFFKEPMVVKKEAKSEEIFTEYAEIVVTDPDYFISIIEKHKKVLSTKKLD